MLLLGLLLVAAAGTFAGLLIVQNPAGPQDAVSVLGFEIGRLSTAQAFMAGIALALACCLGIALVAGSARRRHRRRAAWGGEQREAGGIQAERDDLDARWGAPIDWYDDDMERTAPLVPLPFPWANPR